MNANFYLEKLHASDEFKDFISKNPSAVLCSGFFVIDKEKNSNQMNFDYSSNELDKIFSFQVGDKIVVNLLDKFGDKNVSQVSDNLDFEFKEIESLIEKEMKNQNASNKIQRIMLSLQEKENRNYLFGTIFVSMFGLIKTTISLPDKKIEEFEKKSLFDIIKITK